MSGCVGACITALVFILTLYLLYDRKCKRKLAHIPGPTPRLLVGDLHLFKNGPQRAQLHIVRTYGRVAKVMLGNESMVVLSDLELVKSVVSDFDNFPNRPSKLNFMKSKNLLFAEGAYWKKIRRIVSPTFNVVHLKPFGAFIHNVTDKLVSKLGQLCDGKPYNIHEILGNLTLDVIGLSAFDTNLDTVSGREGSLVEATKTIFKLSKPGISGNVGLIMTSLFPFIDSFFFFLLRTLSFKLKYHSHVLDEHAKRIIAERKKLLASGGTPPEDVLTLLLNARDKETGEPLDDDEVKDQCTVFLLAGYETTANALSYTIYLLAQHPKVEEKLREELKKELNGSQPTYDNVKDLKYLNMVIQESLRMFPPAPVTARKSSVDTHIGPYFIPAKTVVSIPVYAIHRDPEYWPNPDVFDPERFTDENSKNRHPLAHMPFGAGHRICVGLRFALMEMKMVLAKIVQEYHFELVPGQVPLELFSGITMSPKNGIHVVISKVK